MMKILETKLYYNFFVFLLMILLSSCNPNPNSVVNKTNSPIKLFTQTVEITSVKAVNGAAILTWIGSNTAKSYTVKYGTEVGTYTTTASTNATSPYTLTGLTNGHTYYILVTETSSSGTVEAPPVSVTPVASFAITSATAGNQQVSLTFPSVVGASGFTVKYGTSPGSYNNIVSTNATSPFVVTGLTNGRTYYFMVTATNFNGGEQNASAEVAKAPVAPTTAPTGLFVAAATSTQIDLTWNAAIGATSYKVKRATTLGGPYQTIASAGALTTYSDAAITNGVKYYYVVTALNVGGESIASNEVSAKTISSFTSFTASVNTSGQVDLAWSWPTGATSFDVWYKQAIDVSYILAKNVITSSTTLSGLTNGTSYKFLITAKNQDRGAASSLEVTGTPLSSTTPTLATLTPGGAPINTPLNQSIEVSWSAAAGASSYDVMYRTANGTYTTLANQTSPVTLSGLSYTSPGPNYYVKIKSSNLIGSVTGPEVAVTVLPEVPTAPVVSIAQLSNVARLTWPATGLGTVTYTVFRKLDGAADATYAALSNCNGISTLTCTDTNATAGVLYNYIVKAKNEGGESIASVAVSAKTVSSFNITSVTASAANKLQVTWPAVTGATSYTLKYGTTSGSWTTIDSTAATVTREVALPLTAGTRYYFMVTATNANGASLNASTEFSGVPIDAPVTPTASPAVTSTAISWTPTEGATSYDILYGTAIGNYPNVISNAHSGQVVTGLAYVSSAFKYYFVIRAKNANGSVVSAIQGESIVYPPPPLPPGNVVATAGANNTAISWDASSGQGTITYTVLTATVSGGPYTVLAGCENIAALACSHTDMSTPSVLTDAPIYYIVLATADLVNSSADSVEVAAQAIQTFSLTNMEIRGEANSLTVSWDNTIGATSYTVKYKEGAGDYITATTVNAAPGTLSASVSGLTAGLTYDFLVTATNAVGNGASVDSSAPLSGVPLGAFTFTFLPTIGAAAVDTFYSDVTWVLSAGAIDYDIYYDTASHAEASAYTYTYPASYVTGLGASPYVVTTAAVENAVYYVRMRVNNAYGSLYSTNEISTGTWTFKGITSTSGITDSTVTLNWTAHPAATAYKIWTKETAPTAGDWTLAATVTGQDVSTTTLTGLTHAATYSVKVYAVDSAGTSSAYDFSTQSIVMGSAPATPTLTKTSPTAAVSTTATPSFTVTNVKAGDTVKIYKDATCSGSSMMVASAVVPAGATEVSITVPAVAPGVYNFAANATSPEPVISSCSASVPYTIKATVPTSLTLKTPTSSQGLVPRPTLTVAGLPAGATNTRVDLYEDSACATSIGYATVSTTSADVQPTNNLSGGAHLFYVKVTPNGFSTAASDCSSSTGVTASYTYTACPAEYIPVSANATIGTTEFCVMKYEAKNVGGLPKSQAASTPWVSISAQAAKDACKTNGADYDLISNLEWMTIARDIESRAANWTGPGQGTAAIVVGDGAIFRGHTNAYPANALAATATGDTRCDGDCYGATYDDGFGTTYWTTDQKRILSLGSGDIIWDFSGNVHELVDWGYNPGSTTVTSAPTYSCAGTWEEYPTSCGGLFTASEFLPSHSNYDSTQGYGKFHGGTSGTATRGGAHSWDNIAGIYALRLDEASAAHIGFRCVWRPPAAAP